MGIGDTFLRAINPLTPFNDIKDLAQTGAGIIEDKLANKDAPVKFYGNWGGPGHGTDGSVPIDGLDRAFMNHDKNYEHRGYFDTSSDVAFFNQSALNALDPNASHRERLYGAVATGIFAGLAPVSAAFTSVINPIKNADNPLDAAIGIATAPVTTAVNIATDAVDTVKNVISNIFSW